MADGSLTVVYTDGACSGNPGPGGWAWAVLGGRFASGAEKHTTNQRMEIHAVLDALRNLDGPVEVVSDSTYVVNCFRDRWWEGWLKRNWQTSQKKPVANRDLWEPLIDIVRARKADISFRWVKGHSGDAGNDLVDALAVEAGKTQKGKTGDGAPAVTDVASPKAGPEAPPGTLLLVTGHKPPEIGGYGPNETANRVLDKLTEIIAAKKQVSADLRVITGLGLGVEQLAAHAALAAGVPFTAILPYPDQHKVWPKLSQDAYVRLLDQADGEVLLQATTPDSRQAAGGALNRKNAWLARHAAEAVVVWDGEEAFLGKVVRSLQDHLGEADVWIVRVPELDQRQGYRK
jgi:ribonuclease HI